MECLPRRLWSFWHDGQPPPVAASCLDRMRAINPEFTFRLLTDEDIPADRHDVRALEPPQRADWLRLHVLATLGGVWLDATIVLFRSLEAEDAAGARGWLRLRVPPGTTVPEFQGFRFSDAFPRVLDSWAFAGPAGSPFLNAWFAEFDAAVRRGLEQYAADLRARGAVPPGLPGSGPLDDRLPYMTIHVTAVLAAERRPPPAPGAWNVRAATDPEGPLALHAAESWNVRRIVWRVLNDRRLPVSGGGMLKLRGAETALCEALVRRGHFDRTATVPRCMGWDRWEPMEGPRARLRESLMWLYAVPLLVLVCLLLAASLTATPQRGAP